MAPWKSNGILLGACTAAAFATIIALGLGGIYVVSAIAQLGRAVFRSVGG